MDEDKLLKHKLYSFIAPIFALLMLIMCIVIVNSGKEKPPSSNDIFNQYLNEQKVFIETQTKISQNKIDSIFQLLSESNAKIEKLSQSKTQIKYVYIKQSAEIDALNNDGIIKEFNTFFSKSSIKQ